MGFWGVCPHAWQMVAVRAPCPWRGTERGRRRGMGLGAAAKTLHGSEVAGSCSPSSGWDLGRLGPCWASAGCRFWFWFCHAWGLLCASGAVPIPGDTCWARLAHPCCVTGMPSSSPCFKQPPGEPRRHFRSCWGLLASKQTLPPTLSPRATASLQRHLPGAVGTVGTAGLRHPQHRSCTGPGASSSCPRELGCCPAHLCGRAGTRPRSPVWPAGRGERPPPSLGSADGGLFLCFRRAWTGTKPCSRE